MTQATATAKRVTRKVRESQVDDEKGSQKYNILGYQEIPIENILPHPENPRPTFHLGDDDPGLVAMGESIKVDGQHRPAVVYEIVGHWKEEDQPGVYRLCQGERRWRACNIAKVEELRCFVVATPQSEAEEWDWLGIEDAFKQDWQPFFVLRYCHSLAEKHGVPVYSSEISAKTGVAMSDLKVAEKVFKLEPAIQYFAAEYEELMYEQKVKGQRRRGRRLSGSGVRSKEFPVGKAALVWDVFEAMRNNIPLLVQEYSDLELQQLIASKSTQGASIEDLQKLHGQIRQLGKNPPPGLLTEIDELLNNDNHTVRDVVRAAGVEEAGKLNQFMQRSPKLRKIATNITDVISQVGNDPDDLGKVQQEALLLIRDVNELERQLSRRILKLTKERR